MQKPLRLTRADFRKLDLRRREHGTFFTLATALSPEGAKFACVISKKIAPKAHDRNLIRRRARAAFREIAPKAKASYVLTAKASAKSATYLEIFADLRKLIVKAEAGLSA